MPDRDELAADQTEPDHLAALRLDEARRHTVLNPIALQGAIERGEFNLSLAKIAAGLDTTVAALCKQAKI